MKNIWFRKPAGSARLIPVSAAGWLVSLIFFLIIIAGISVGTFTSIVFAVCADIVICAYLIFSGRVE